MNGKMKKLLSVLLSVCMIAGLIPLIALPEADAATSTWDGTTITTSFSGSGTAASPYIIDTAAKLAGVAKLTNNNSGWSGGKYFVQTVDIDLNGKQWTPIGIQRQNGGSTTYSENNAWFRGYYDGNGHVVKNVQVGTSTSSRASVKHVGLFGIIGGSAQIYNLGVETAKYYIQHYCDDERVGGFVGYCKGVIQGCYARNVTINQSGVCVIGGFCGQATSDSTIYKSYAYNVSLTQGSGRKGGFVGDGDGTAAFCFVNYYPFHSGNGDGYFLYAYGENNVTGEIVGNGTDTGYGPESFMSGGSNGGWPQLIWQSTGPLDYNTTDGYVVTTAAQMRSLACFVNNGRSYSGAKIALKADIDLSAYDWAPIGINHSKRDRFFSGTFNGNGYIVSNMKIGTSSSRNTYYIYKGLFGYTSNAVINCVGIKNAQIYGNGPTDYRCGALVGQADGGSGKIYQCYVKGSTVNMSGTGVSGVIVGDVRHNLTDCYTLNSTATGTRAGSVVGDMKSTVYNVYSGGCTSTTASYTSENKGTPVNCNHNISASTSAGCVSTFNSYANKTDYWKSSGAWMTDTYSINSGYACLKWEPRFSIAFNGNGGSLSGTTTLTGRYQYTATTPSASRTGYDFKGYFAATSGGSSVIGGGATYTFGTTAPSNSAQTGTLYAQWTAHTYTVAYDGNGKTGGSTASSSHTYDVAKNLTANGYERKFTVTYNYNYTSSSNTSATATATFNGWATSATGAKVYNNSQSVTNLTATNGATVTLYAKWTDESVTLPTPTRTGYTFGGWYGESGCTTSIGAGGASYTPTANKTLYAKWTPITYTVTYDGNGKTSGSTASSSHTYDTAKNLTTNGYSRSYTVSYDYKYNDVNNQPVTGSATATATFNGWATSASGAKAYDDGQSVLNLRSTAGTFPLFAHWTLAKVTLPNPTRGGYQFGGWFTNSACTTGQQSGGAEVTPTADITYFAKWTPNTFKVHFNGSGATSGTMADQNFTFDVPQNLTENAFKKEYTVSFDHKGGSGDASATAMASFNGWATTATGVRVYLDKEEVSNLTATNNGTVDLWASWGAIPAVTLPDSSLTGYTFNGWYSDANLTNKVGDAGGSYIPAANGVTLYAKHTINTYEITFKGADGAVLKNETVEHGQTPDAPPIPGKAPTAAQHFSGAWNTPVVAATGPATYTVVYTGVNHSGGEATCKLQAVCGVCGTPYGETNGTNHKNTHTTEAVTANCVTEGFTAGVFCDDCNTYISGHESQGYDTSEAGHVYGDWESNGNNTHTKTCSRCAAETTNHAVTANCSGGTATCKALAVCDDCGAAYGDYAAHQLTEVPAVAPSCLEPGHVAYWHCEVCEKDFTDNTGATEVTAFQNAHSFTAADTKEDALKTEADCSGPAVYYYSCAVCGTVEHNDAHTFTDGDPKPHSYLYTPNNDGTHTVTCAKCDYTGTANCEYNETPHETTCTTGAYITYACNVCGYTYDGEAGEPNGHTYGAWESNDNGTHTKTCSVCAEGTDGHTVTADCDYNETPHDATCTTGAYITYACKVCDYTYDGETGEPNGHTYGDWVSNEDGTHTKTCSVCAEDTDGHTVTADCDYDETPHDATCITGAYSTFTCSVCGYTYDSEAGEPNGHTYGAWESNDNGTHTKTCSVCAEGTDGHTVTADCDYEETPHAATCTTGTYITYTCKVCGYTYDGEAGEPNGHTYGAWESNDNGTHTKTCSVCAEGTDGHTVTADCDYNETPHAATCTTGAYTTYTCKVCDYTYDGEAGEPNGHTYGDWAPNEDGTHTKTCSVCAEGTEGHTVTADCDYNETPHDATCTTGAYTTYTCKVCGYTYDSEAGEPNGHTYGDWAPNEDGTHTKTCSVCAEGTDGHTVTADCDYNETPHDATCTTGAYSTFTCNVCGYTYDSEAGEPNGHTYGEWVSNEDGTHTKTCSVCAEGTDGHTVTADCDYDETPHDATCTTGAYTTYTCKVCGYTYDSEAGEPNGHTYGAWESNDDGTHTKTCSVCAEGTDGHTVTADCDYDETPHDATCVKGSYTTYVCRDCGYTYDSEEADDKLDHSYVYTPSGDGTHTVTCTNCDLNETEAHVDGEPVIENEVAATCDAAGSYDTVVYCERCGAEISRETHTVTKDHTPAQPVKEHEVAVTCTTDGSYEIVVYCADCGTELSRESKTVTAPGHKWDDGVTTAATCAREGKTVYTCKTCGETRTETIAIDPGNHAGGTEVRGKVEATKNHDGYTGDTYCKGCGELLKEGHAVSYQEGECPYCGGHHTGVLGAIITAIHGIIWLFHKAFGLGNPFAA